jgi:RNA polymerase sigma-70 factor (ECF subfamily)
VARWARARGANEADVEDLTQEVFIIVRRKLAEFDGRNLAGFLYRITERTVRDHRRSAWFRNLLRGQAPLAPEAGAHDDGTLETIQRREGREALAAILAKMSDKRRTTFILFEIEGYTGEEIARIQSLPVDTVWTRLHHARKDFKRLVAEHQIRAGIVLAVLLVSVAAAAATGVRGWPLLLRGHAREDASPAAIASPVVSLASRATPGAGPVNAGSVDPASAATVVSSNSPVASPELARAPATQGTRASQRETGVAEDESTLMVRAVRALRRDGDPARAQALAEQALQRFPHGAQVEEAMALVMEAASARGDATGAQRAATAYLARFRSGRFAERAQHLLASPAR